MLKLKSPHSHLATMTLQTIECRLYAPPPTLQLLWELMAEKNTPLINALLDLINEQAERKIPGYKDGQKQYAKQYRINVHQWSYRRLLDSIQQASAKAGITIEIAKQSTQGNPQEKAKNLAIGAYLSRLEQVF